MEKISLHLCIKCHIFYKLMNHHQSFTFWETLSPLWNPLSGLHTSPLIPALNVEDDTEQDLNPSSYLLENFSLVQCIGTVVVSMSKDCCINLFYVFCSEWYLRVEVHNISVQSLMISVEHKPPDHMCVCTQQVCGYRERGLSLQLISAFRPI